MVTGFDVIIDYRFGVLQLQKWLSISTLLLLNSMASLSAFVLTRRRPPRLVAVFLGRDVQCLCPAVKVLVFLCCAVAGL
jgi:hypothetical protein